jgi:hypothetical protein
MCEECDVLQQKITHFRRFLAVALDPLTTERIKGAVAEYERRILAKHEQDEDCSPHG